MTVSYCLSVHFETAKLDDFKISGGWAVNVDFDQSALRLPAGMAGGAGIDVKAVETVVVHDLENMTVAADKYPRSGFVNHLGYPGLISPGIAADVCHEHIHILHSKLLNQREIAATFSGVDVAVDSAHDWADLFEAPDYIHASYVARMPYLVAVGEIGGKTRVPA